MIVNGRAVTSCVLSVISLVANSTLVGNGTRVPPAEFTVTTTYVGLICVNVASDSLNTGSAEGEADGVGVGGIADGVGVTDAGGGLLVGVTLGVGLGATGDPSRTWGW